MTKCSKYYRYKGYNPPKCTTNITCAGCTSKYKAYQLKKAERLIIPPCVDCGTIEKGYDSTRCKACSEIQGKLLREVRNENRQWYRDNGHRIALAITATKR